MFYSCVVAALGGGWAQQACWLAGRPLACLPGWLASGMCVLHFLATFGRAQLPGLNPPPLPPLPQVMESVVQALLLHGALEATLAAAPAELVAGLLQHVRRQLGSPQHARGAIGLTHCLLSSCPAALAADGPAQDRLQQLRGAVVEELKTQEALLALQGIVGAVMHAA